MLTFALVSSIALAAPQASHVDASATVAAGLGLSPNSASADVLPIVALNADVPIDDWFVGGGAAVLTYIDPQFPEDDFVPRIQVHVIGRGGLVLWRGESAEIVGDGGLMIGIVRNFLRDVPASSVNFAPSVGATSTVRAIWRFDRFNVQTAAGLTVVTAGVLQFAPTISAGVGWRF